MLKFDQSLLSLLEEGISLPQLREVTSLNRELLFSRFQKLKNKGYQLERFYDEKGIEYYTVKNGFKMMEFQVPYQMVRIMANDHLDALILSDTHLGHELENVKALQEVCYMAKQKGIHFVFHAGDFLSEPKMIEDPYPYRDVKKQIDHALDSLPYSERVTHLMLFGNHDYRIFQKGRIDVSKVLENRRPDIVSLGYGIGLIRLEHDIISLCHKVKGINPNNDPLSARARLQLIGHRHYYKADQYQDHIQVILPSLSEIPMTSDSNIDSFPSALLLHLDLQNGTIRRVKMNQLGFFPNLVSLNEVTYDMASPNKAQREWLITTFPYQKPEYQSLSSSELESWKKNFQEVKPKSLIKR